MQPLVRRLKSCWPAIALAVLAGVVLIASLADLRGPPDAAVRTVDLGNGIQQIAWVGPAGSSWEAGLRPGDQVKPVAVPAGTGAFAAYEVLSGPQAGRLALIRRPWSGAVDATFFALGLEFLAVALLVFLLASDRPAASRFLVLAGATAVTLLVTPADGVGHPWALFVEWVGNKAVAAALTLFFFTVPVQRWRLLQRAILAAYPLLVALDAYTFLIDPALYDTVKTIGFLYLGVGGLASVAALAWPFVALTSPAQRQLRAVLVCTLVPVGVLVFGSLLPDLLFGRYWVSPEIGILSWTLLPLGFAWAFLRYRLMGVPLGDYAVLSSVFETVPDPIFVVEPGGRLVQANPAGLALLGVSRATQEREPFPDALASRTPTPAESARATHALLERALAGQAVQGEEQTLCLPDGSTCYASVAATPVLNMRGQAATVVLLYRNVTSAEERFRGLVENSVDGVLLCDEAGAIIEWNRGAESITQLTRAELLGRPIWDVMFQVVVEERQSQTAYEEQKAALLQVLHTGQRPGLGGRIHYTIRRPEGSERTVEVAAFTIRTDRGFRLGAIWHDDTEEILAEDRLRRESARVGALAHIAARLTTQLDLQLVLDAVCEETARALNAPAVSVALYDESRDVFYVAADFGLPPEHRARREPLPSPRLDELIRQRDYIIVIPDAQASSPLGGADLYAALNVRSIAAAAMSRDGQVIGALSVFTFEKVRQFDDDDLALLRGLADQAALAISNARLYERAQRYAAELEQRVAERTVELQGTVADLESFNYSISHDLRAPIRAIHGFAEILLEDYAGQLDPVGQQHLRSILSGARRMDDLTSALLAYSRVSRADLELQAVSLERTVRSTLAELEAELRERGAEVQVRDPLPEAMGHPVTLNQVLANLLSNAAKFVAPGAKPRARVWVEERGDWLRLWVEDNGIGIAPEHQERIFRPFERLHGGETYAGTGIGLAIVAKAVSRMGGRVGVESQLGQGSRFWIELRRVGGKARHEGRAV